MVMLDKIREIALHGDRLRFNKRLDSVSFFDRLPRDVRNFYAYIPEDGISVDGSIDTETDTYDVSFIKGIDGDRSSVMKDANNYFGRISRYMLPIADDMFGNLFLLSVRKKDFGSVYFWDHEFEYDEDYDEGTVETYEDNLTKVAVTFTDFVLNIRRNEDV